MLARSLAAVLCLEWKKEWGLAILDKLAGINENKMLKFNEIQKKAKEIYFFGFRLDFIRKYDYFAANKP